MILGERKLWNTVIAEVYMSVGMIRVEKEKKVTKVMRHAKMRVKLPAFGKP